MGLFEKGADLICQQSAYPRPTADQRPGSTLVPIIATIMTTKPARPVFLGPARRFRISPSSYRLVRRLLDRRIAHSAPHGNTLVGASRNADQDVPQRDFGVPVASSRGELRIAEHRFELSTIKQARDADEKGVDISMVKQARDADEKVVGALLDPAMVKQARDADKKVVGALLDPAMVKQAQDADRALRNAHHHMPQRDFDAPVASSPCEFYVAEDRLELSTVKQAWNADEKVVGALLDPAMVKQARDIDQVVARQSRRPKHDMLQQGIRAAVASSRSEVHISGNPIVSPSHCENRRTGRTEPPKSFFVNVNVLRVGQGALKNIRDQTAQIFIDV